MKSRDGKQNDKNINIKTQEKRARRVAVVLFGLVVIFSTALALYSRGTDGYDISKAVYNVFEGGAFRMISPAVCFKSDREMLEKLKTGMFDNAVKTSLWVISPASEVRDNTGEPEIIYEPMYADYLELKSSLNDTVEDFEGPLEEEEESIAETVSIEETTEAETAPVENGVLEEAPKEEGEFGLPVATGMVYSAEQLQDFDFLKNNFYFVHSSTTVTPEQLDAGRLLAKDLSIVKDPSVPQILIYHTHAYEAFIDSVEGGEDMTIVGAGNYLTELLTNVYGYNVIHDTTLYHYNDAYSEACEHISSVLAQNPSIQLVIDLHRDAANEGTRLVTEVNGKQTAKVMFFTGMCQTVSGPLDYVSNPYLDSTLALGLQMKLLAEEYYPGFTRKNFLKAYRYNQHLAERCMLIEAGANTNTYSEVKNAMEPLAAMLNEVLSGNNH